MRETETPIRLNPGRGLAVPAVVLMAAVLSGCFGAPTYGTGTPADQQLVHDVTGILDVTPNNRARTAYNPRPGLVMPSSTEVLPPPQEDVAAAGNSAWPESPEERLARIRAEATANQDNPAYRSPIVQDVAARSRREYIDDRDENGRLDPAAARRKRELMQQQAQLTQLDPAQRRYLSDPPAEYRAAVSSAPSGELGEDEAAKERAAKAAARQGGGGWNLGRLWPWGGG